MHKITKGIKKKKKGKKSKHKEEELFKPEELEAYRREHQQPSAPTTTVEVVNGPQQDAPATGNDEWKKFNALTAGIDSFLKKTQDDLDRIKSTSFFQRVPPASQLKKEQEAETSVQNQEQTHEREVTEEEFSLKSGIVHVSESESEEEDEEDIFDTAYIDAIAAGQVKLAYIPESPVEAPEGDDPFDTAIAERAILGPAVTRKGKKLVPLGAAVEVLTGRVQAPTCVPIKRPTRRVIQRDLLLDSFDDTATVISVDATPPDNKPSLLDDDSTIPHFDEPIDLSQSLHLQQVKPTETQVEKPPSNKNLLEEFDVIKTRSTPEDDDDKEFALLAAESLSKTAAVAILPSSVAGDGAESSWQAFDGHKDVEDSKAVDDPFDTTFAENVAPGKFELKIIENEILSSNNDYDFNPRAEDTLKELITSSVSIHITNPSGKRDSLERISEFELNVIQLQHRDLLGGSITDLSGLGDQPLQPKEKVDENYIEYCDPFDTTIVDTVTIPGQTELKFLEQELLSDITTGNVNNKDELSDDEFDPRADETLSLQYSTRKISTGSLKSVNFVLPITESDLFAIGQETGKKISKPLTPYYTRENSLPEQPLEEEFLEDVDPFDTSFVAAVGPGKAELKVIEKELFQTNPQQNIQDSDFNPRDDKQVAVAKVVQTIKEISEQKITKPSNLSFDEPNVQIDLLGADNEVSTKVLTPAAEKSFDEINYFDPFDTSIASNILPGKAELKLLETELIHSSNAGLKRVLTDPDFNPRDSIDTKEEERKSVSELLEVTNDTIITRTLTPTVKFNIEDDDDDGDYIDPFDTSIANNIGPGQTELKLLESELI